MFLYSIKELNQNSKICLYGKGSRSIGFEKLIKKIRNDIEIIDHIDSSTLEEFISKNKKYDLIIIASAYWKEIKENLINHNIKNFKCIGDASMYIESTEIKTKDFEPIFKESINIFEQKEHQELYSLLYKVQTNQIPLSKITEYWQKNLNEQEESQYFDFINKNEIKTVIDAGVYDGATINKFAEELINLKTIYGFEPLKERFDYSKLNTKQLEKFEIYPEGLWDKKTSLGFELHEGLGQGSSISKNGKSNTTIKTTTLDEFAKTNKIDKIDLIKMDIENAELNALQGGLNTIKKDRPQLAICIYHSIEQFTKIPLFVKANLTDYSYYLSHYSWNKTETILYAIPNELKRA